MLRPIIITGMHRSGTTMLAEILSDLGLYIGYKYGINKEAFFFMQRNEWLLRRSGGAWDNPLPFNHLLNNSKLILDITNQFNEDINSFRFLEYTGLFKNNRFLKGYDDCHFAIKDPRFIFTLPIWQNVFDEFKVISITRNGVDVAKSLYKRANKSLSNTEESPLSIFNKNRRLRNLFSIRETYLLNSVRCLNKFECFDLWEEYNFKMKDLLNSLPNEKLNLKYEDFLVNPEQDILRLANFCNVEISQKKIYEISKKIDKSKIQKNIHIEDNFDLVQYSKESPFMKGYL